MVLKTAKIMSAFLSVMKTPRSAEKPMRMCSSPFETVSVSSFVLENATERYVLKSTPLLSMTFSR